MRIFIALLICFFGCMGVADLRVYPTRLVLSDSKRVTDISLRHVGNTPMTYKISLVYYKMKPDGSLELSNTPATEERSAVKLFRFSPRQVTLAPNVEQVVRVMYSGGKELAEGEYRAHIHFEPTESEAAEPTEKTKAKADEKPKMTMRLQARVAVAVPVIFRHGNVNFELKLSNLKLLTLPDKSLAYDMAVESQGTAFAFGDLYAFFVPKGGEPISFGVVKSFSSYLPKRTLRYALNPPADFAVSPGGLLRVEFRSPEEDGGKVLASTDLPVK